MKLKFAISAIVNSAVISLIANSFYLIKLTPYSLFAIIPIFILVNIFAGVFFIRANSKKSVICAHGTILLYSFYFSIIISSVYQIIFAIKTITIDYKTVIWSIVFCIVIHFIVFWNGIICVYLTSAQLGIKWRIIGIFCGMIPIANLVVLFYIIKISTRELLFEIEKEKLNRQRSEQKLCKTKYPILLVHGVFFRDSKYFNYWGRIPKELETNGATVFYGNHHSASSVHDSANELCERIKQIAKETGLEKVNIIAHSKGGLDCRYAISKLDAAPYVASLTTINTPHKGCLFADYLLNVIPKDVKNKVASTYNRTLKKFGEESPDFLAAVSNLTDEYCKRLESEMPAPNNIFCQSVGSTLKKASGGCFPLNFSYHLVKYFDGKNDGLVSENSFKWGEKYTLITPIKERGISHADMIDLTRKNIDGFDVREFYVTLVKDLKNRDL